MPYKINKDTQPQLSLLLIATALSIVLWLLSQYLPLLGWVFYPLQLFATFIHEGGHVLATVLTGNSVQSLTVSPDGSGAVWSQTAGWFSQLLISSAGYLGTTVFGVGLLAWIRYGFSSRIALLAAAGYVSVMTIAFGLFAPFLSFLQTVTIGSVFFTVLSGSILAAGLATIAYFANLKWANFAVAFLAVQCLLNAVFSIVDLFWITTLTTGHSDAVNMANATGIPAVLWVLIWFVISVVMISLGLRLYAVGRRSKADSVFED